MDLRFVCFFDGACSMKRGLAAGAAVLYDDAGTELAVDSHLLRDCTTPVAEYVGMHLALRLAAAHAGADVASAHLTVLGDAELVVRQVDGRYRALDPRLAAMRDLAHLLMRPFASAVVRELPKAGPKNKRRFGNQRADELAGQCVAAAVASLDERTHAVTR